MAKTPPVSWADMVKKVVYTSIGSAVFAREAVSQAKLPQKDAIVQAVLSRLERSKDDIINILAKEVSGFLGKINVSEEVIKALQGLVINLNASVDFDRKKKTPRTTVHSAKVSKK